MSESYVCFTCHKVSVAVSEKKCLSCGSANGQFISPQRLEEGIKNGTYFNIDLRTGKRAKKRK